MVQSEYLWVFPGSSTANDSHLGNTKASLYNQRDFQQNYYAFEPVHYGNQDVTVRNFVNLSC